MTNTYTILRLFIAMIVLAALQQQVDALESQVADLEGNLNDHSHDYLTGRGRGHNKITANTGPAMFP